MRSFYKLLILFIGFAITFQKASAQNVTNEGLEFWLCFPDHVPSEDKVATMSLFITSKSNSSGVVSCGATYSQPFTVQANTVREILVPRDVSFLGRGSGVFKNKGIKVKVDDGKAKVVVYAHVFAGFRSAATLVLPYEALGRKHFAMAYDQEPKGDTTFHSQIEVVAVESNTTINIKPVVNGIAQPAFSKTLVNPGDVYQYQNLQDITGTLVEVDSVSSGCKRIAVFSGSSGIAINTPTCNVFPDHASADPLLQQLYPIQSWGKTFPLIPFYDKNAGSIYRVIASEDNTTVTVNGITTVLNAGKFYSSPPITSVSLINADKPISVAQFAISEFCSDSRNEFVVDDVIFGDPDMVILNPLEYSIDKITLYSSSKLAITEQYLNVVIPTAKVPSFTINKNSFSSSFSPVPTAPDYSYAQIALTGLGSNFSLAADTGFNAMAYGFGPVESYAYSAGTSLAATTIVNALKYGTNDVVDVACVNQSYDFKLLLPYIPTKLVWQLETNSTPFVQDNPTYTQVSINKKLLYQFKLPANKVFTSSGTKNIVITASIPVGANVCSTIDEEKINFTFEVSDLPVAEFTAPAKVCITKTAKFNYVEKNIGGPVISWLWDFGDGTTSTEQSPSHTYAALGTYKVKLSLTSEVGCNSQVTEKSISVIDPLVNGFEIVSPLCTNSPISFVDQSTSTDGINWLWDFGDGATSTEQNPFHIYSKSGTYKVNLITTSQTGCSESLEKTMKITDPAEIDFPDPGSCINDLVAFEAEIKTGNVSAWLWDFGDGSVDAVESVKQKTQHRYLSIGRYNVTLKAVSSEGCVTTLTKSITISGSNPKVSFDVLDKDNLCSNTEVNFKNTSTIVFGNIVKLEIIYENKIGGTSVIYTDNSPEINKIYIHKYPASSLDQNYQVIFRAYSGQSCYQESAPVTVTIHGSPEVKFDNVDPICLNAPKFLLSAVKEITGIKGTAKLAGEGVVGNYFDPAVAGAGSHVVTYTFISTKGCQQIITNTIKVVDIPTVDAGAGLDILLAGEKQIKAKVTGNNVKYKWTPAIGLSNDSIPDPIASPTESTKYTLVVTSKDGCAVADEVNVTVHTDPMIPNVFSPNADGINDTWSIKYLETFVKATIRIFNRAGQQVFFSTQYTTPWDGKFHNADAPVGVYYYIIEPNNGRNRYTGSVTLLR